MQKNASETDKIIPAGNHLKLTAHADFARGVLSNLSFADRLGDGALRLKKVGEGCFTTPVVETEKPFNDLVASWNTETPAGTKIEVAGRVYLPAYDGWQDRAGNRYDGWSDWITWGEWSTHIARHCPECQDTHPRQDSEEKNGWVFAYSKPGWGDSSLNVRGTLTATAFQLRVTLTAEDGCEGLPSLRLLAATWKNTNDPHWQDDCTYPEESVPQAESVLLDTPAISQMRRDPDYAHVVCSATTITMMMNGQGEDLLPEDAVLLGFDHGFGGNGNWSFTCALAGAYGFESYVSYSGFAALRQELSKGYAVGLSVKYSDKQEDTLPYLENAPCRTGGHLICIVGYYYNRTLGEYVYCANDPAGESDAETAHREYRQSQLDACWYRRAAYFLHKKESGAGGFARDRVQAELRPVRDRENTFALVAKDGLLRIPADFLQEKRTALGQHGTICYYAEEETTALPNTCRRVTANHVFRYDGIAVTPEGYLTFPDDGMNTLLAEGKKVRLVVLDNCDTVYEAQAVPGKPFSPEYLMTEEEQHRRDQLRNRAKGGAMLAGVLAAAAAAGYGIKKLLRKKKQ